MTKKTIIIISVCSFLLVALALFLLSSESLMSHSLGQLYRNQYTIFGRVTNDELPVIGAEVKAYLEHKPDKAVVVETMNGFNGFYQLNIQKLDWRTGDVLVLRAASSGLVGESKTVLRGAVGKSQEINVETHRIDFMPKGTTQLLSFKFTANNNALNAGKAVLEVSSNQGVFLVDSTPEKGFFTFNLKDLPKGWFVGEYATIKYYYQGKLLAQARIVLSSGGVQEFNIPLRFKEDLKHEL